MGVSGKIYFTITTGKQVGDEISHAIPGDPHLNDAYEIIELTATTYRSKAQDSGNDITQKRVDDGFQFPAFRWSSLNDRSHLSALGRLLPLAKDCNQPTAAVQQTLTLARVKHVLDAGRHVCSNTAAAASTSGST